MVGGKQPVFLVSVIAGLVEGCLAFLIGQAHVSLRVNSLERIQFLILCIITGFVLGVCAGSLAESSLRSDRPGVLIKIVLCLLFVQIILLYFAMCRFSAQPGQPWG
jgi:uncharacterized membrane protein YeaQ/YmgE (transglycosylase-associated protein family)